MYNTVQVVSESQVDPEETEVIGDLAAGNQIAAGNEAEVPPSIPAGSWIIKRRPIWYDVHDSGSQQRILS